MTREEIKTIKIGDRIKYEGTNVEVTYIDECRISFKGIDNTNDGCSNIPLYESRPRNLKTNIQLLTK